MQKKTLALSAGLAPVLILAGSASAGGTDFADNFDSYSNGQGVVGMNGWESWCGTGENANASNVFSNSPPNSLHTDSFDDIVQDTDENALTSGQWVLEFNHYVDGAATGVTFIIGLNSYCNTTNNWSLQLAFDADQNIVEAQGPFGGMGGNEQTALIRDQWVPVRVEIDLDNDLQDIYYNNQLLVDDRSWSNGVSNNGQGIVAISCFDFFSNGSIEGSFFDDVVFGPAPSGPEAGMLTNVTIINGSDPDMNGITIANLTQDDNVIERWRTVPGFNVQQPNIAEIRYEGTTTGTSLNSVLSRENANSNQGFAQVRAFNYNTNQNVLLGQYNLTFGNGAGNDVENIVNATGTQYVSGNGDFRIQIRYVALVTFAPDMDVWQDQFVAFFD